MDLDKLLYSLIPLLIIIAISWFFSFLGSRANKARQEAEAMSGTGSGSGSDNRERLLDLLSFENDDDEEEMVGSRQAYMEDAHPEEPGRFAEWEAAHRKGAPVVKPDPIKPKWWGA